MTIRRRCSIWHPINWQHAVCSWFWCSHRRTTFCARYT